MEKDFSFDGGSLSNRFGHTITPITREKAIIFGGAVGDLANKYLITGDTFLCDYIHRKFKRLQNQGQYPSNRAAHASISIENTVFIFGGALGGGEFADDHLYQLDVCGLIEIANWKVKDCGSTSPGGRYGHVMGFIKPYLIVHGGNIGSRSMADVWVNDVFLNCRWAKVETGSDGPSPRVYHSASMCRNGVANGMMVIFGGRGNDSLPLNDTWGLRKHTNGQIDWMRAPYKNIEIRPTQRYQHSSLFIGTLLLIIGGKNNNVGQSMTLDIYDTDTSLWHRFQKIDRFRHISFLANRQIFIQGGFEQSNLISPTDKILRINLHQHFLKDPILFRGLSLESDHEFITHTKNAAQRKNSQQKHSHEKLISNKEVQNYDSHKMQIQYSSPHKTQSYENRQIKLSPEIFVASSQTDLMRIKINQLQSQNKKLTQKVLSSFSKDYEMQDVYTYFLNGLFMKPFPPATKYEMPQQYTDRLFAKLYNIFQSQDTLLKIRAPVKVFGDLHGQFNQLYRLFEAFGAPTDEGKNGDIQSTNYLFLGDIVDRGTTSFQLILLILNLKVKYPENIFILRGGHQDQIITRSMGFGDQCEAKINQDINNQNSFFQKCNRLFQMLPLAALVNDQILCLHGGIGSTLTTLNEIQNIKRPIKINHRPQTKEQTIVYDILWSDPCSIDQPNETYNQHHDYFKMNTNMKFPAGRAYQFCVQNQLISIIRSGQPILEGFQNAQSLITIFSCSNYGNCGNKSAIINISKNSQLIPMVLTPPVEKELMWQDCFHKQNSQSRQQAHLRSLTVSFTPPK